MLNNDVNPTTLSRLELLKLAQTLHVSDADVMTRAELRAAIERARKVEPRPAPQPVTWLGVARRLLASIVEQGLHLPDAAAVIRGDVQARSFPSGPPPVATVTLARIYAAQGHLERGIGTLDEVLESDPDHDLARDLRAQLLRSLEERRQQERDERAAGAAAKTLTADPESELEAAAGEESSPASDLLGAIPAAPSETPEAEPETQRGSGAPAAPLDAAPAAMPALEGAEAAVAPPAETPELTRFETVASVPVAATPSESVTNAAVPTATLEPVAGAIETAPVEAAAAVEPRSAGLVLIETSEPSTYLYWELASPLPVGNGEPHWVCVVTHSAQGAESQRRERRFPVYRPSGAVRIEGLPSQAVVRAKLSRGEAPEAPPLVVAGAVWASAPSELERAELRFVPHAAAQPVALAARAADHLASAAPLYY